MSNLRISWESSTMVVSTISCYYTFSHDFFKTAFDINYVLDPQLKKLPKTLNCEN